MTLFDLFRNKGTAMEGSLDDVHVYANYTTLFDELDGLEGGGSLDDVIDLNDPGCLEETATLDAVFMEYPDDCIDEPIYEDLTPVNCKKMFNTELFTKTLTDWTRHYPQVWTSDDVYSWIMQVATDPRSGIDLPLLRGENFHVDGQTLCAMSVEQFKQADVRHGEVLYWCLRDLLTNCSPFQGLPSFDIFFPKQGSYPTAGEAEVGENENVNFFQQDESSSSVDDGYSSSENNSMLPTPVDAMNVEAPTIVTDPYSGIESYKDKSTKHNAKPKNVVPSQWTPKQQDSRYCPVSKKPPNRPACRRPRRSLSSSSDNDSDDSLTSIRRTGPRKPGEGFKGKHLWEFIRDLLHNNQSNPCLIRWEDREEGIFRIVNSREVARLWGNRKGNSDMTYEKLSRAMRFCRTAKYFENVPRDRNLPRKLCFKFGPKAEDWQIPTLHPTPAPLSNRIRRLAIN